MNKLDLFTPFIKKSLKPKLTAVYKSAVAYTRVSSKEQAETNLSLDFQKRYIDDFATRVNLPIAAYFGGTYESAKTDGRKEFTRMLEFIRRNRNSISHLLVYSLSRFSRTGGEAIKIADEIRDKYGVVILAVTQPIDTTNAGGKFQQDIQLLFSRFDNDIRKQQCHAGIREKMEQGYWARMAPLGYDSIRENNKRTLKINKTGRLIKQAFEWKARGMKNEAIMERLAARGLKLYAQKLSYIFSNVFYCGMITDKILEGKMVEGKHEPLVSRQLFLEVNEIRKTANKYGTHHETENNNIPLKLTARCPKCGRGYTGYIIKAKNLYYYKCPTKGCCVSISAKQLNGDFESFLGKYNLKPELVEPLIDTMKELFHKTMKENETDAVKLKARMNDLDKQFERLEEKYFLLNEMEGEQYRKWHQKLLEEKMQILNLLNQFQNLNSNVNSYLEKAVHFSSELSATWRSSNAVEKEKLHKLVFPKGFVYNKENREFLTSEVNSVFALIADVQGNTGQNKNGQGGFQTTLSNHVGKTGFEPATPWSQTRCATGLRYFPKLFLHSSL
jgi:site-specific DNA recombinase